MRQLESEMHFVKNYRRCFAGKPLVASSKCPLFSRTSKICKCKDVKWQQENYVTVTEC